MFKGSSNKLRSAFGGFKDRNILKLFSYSVYAYLMLCNMRSQCVFILPGLKVCVQEKVSVHVSSFSSFEQCAQYIEQNVLCSAVPFMTTRTLRPHSASFQTVFRFRFV